MIRASLPPAIRISPSPVANAALVADEMDRDDMAARVDRRALSMSAKAVLEQAWKNRRASGDAGEKALLDRCGVEIAADEDEPALALLVGLPVALMIAVEHHVHALQDETLRIVLERENALAAQDFRAFLGTSR